MADEIIKEEKETEENKKANTAPTGRERFKELAARINQADKEALARRSERERLLKEGEAAREKSLDDTMSRMAENTELAKKAASERIARLEYRQSIMERTRRKRRTEAPISAAAEFAKPEEQLEIQSEASELSLEKADAEEYNEPKAVCTEALCAEESCAKSEAEATEKAEAEPFEEACEPPEATLGAEPEISGEAENTGETDALSVPEAETDAASVPDENDADIYSEKIILNINPEKKLDVEEDGDNVIRIGARQIFGVGAAAAVAHRVHIPRVGVSDPSAARAQILEAQRRHVALRNAAISNAAGAYEEEVRLLEEEEARYHAEIEQLRAKRLDLYERRDAFAPTAFAEEAREADLFDSFDEGSLYDRRIDEDAAIKEYEKTRRAELEFLRAAEEYELGESLEHVLRREEYPYPDVDGEEHKKALLDYERVLEKEEIYDDGEEDDLALMDVGVRDMRKDEDLGLFAKTQLAGKLNAYHREEAALARKYKRVEKKQRSVSEDGAAALIVEKIGIQKEITELAIDALTACVYVGARSKISKYKAHLSRHIDRYNAICDEYEINTGRPVTRISPEIAGEVAAGRICQPIPNVYLTGEDIRGRSAVRRDENEMYRFAKQYDEDIDRYENLGEDSNSEISRAHKRAREKERAQKMSEIKRAAERDVLLIGLRNDYLIADLEAERDMLVNSFGNRDKEREAKIRHLDRKIDKIKSSTRRALKLEREDNARYYLLMALDEDGEKIRKGARSERLEALKMRLEVLLSERERINESLIALYGGSDKRLSVAKIGRKAGAVRKKYAKYMYKKQKRLAAKINSMKAPLDIKEKAFAILNKKTAAVATVEECRYKLRKMNPKGRAKRELVSDLKRAKSSIRSLDADLKFLMRKIRRHHERYIDDRNWGIVLIVCALLLAAGIAAWYFFGRNINFQDLLSKFGWG